jgi:methylisocitrate lyase
VIPRKKFADKIRFACRQRDRSDKDFVIIARSDSCRFEGLDEAIGRVNLAAEHGADMEMIFPRDFSELQQAPKLSKVPLVYVVSRGNRDSRPVASAAQLADMGYKLALDAGQLSLQQARAGGAQGDRRLCRPQPRGMRDGST